MLDIANTHTKGDEGGPPILSTMCHNVKLSTQKAFHLWFSVCLMLIWRNKQSSCMCVHRYVCVFPRVVNTPDKKEKAQGPLGTNFPSLFQRPVHYCKQEGTILHGPPTSFAAIFSHSPALLLKHNSAPPRLPTVHHCTPVKPRLVAVGSPKFQSCRRCLEHFLSPSIFHLSCFREWK